MAGVNKVILLGNLGRDPEISYTQSGMAICKFSIATSKKKRDGSEKTEWHRCTAFDKRAETISRYVSKGQQLYVEGELSYGQYDKDGITRYTTDIIVNNFTFVSSRPSNQGGDMGSPGQGQQDQQGQNQGGGYQQNEVYDAGQPNNAPPEDDDIPF